MAGTLSAENDAAVHAGIRRLAIPTPFLVGRVNVYLIEDEPLTLVDTGPNSGKALDELERGLAGLGYAIEDLGLIVLTHQHVDHVGLAEILARRSGADVAAIDRLAPYLEHYSANADADDAFAQALMLRHGIGDELVEALHSMARAMRSWGTQVEVTRPLADGSSLELRDRTLTVHHRPGHSPSDTVFWDAERTILIAGDHLIKHISSNPFISRPLPRPGHPGYSEGDPRPRALIDYIASMRATRDIPATLVLPGHGDEITEHAALIDERFALHERRARKIARILSAGPLSAHEIAREMWGGLVVTQAYLTLSEVLGHVDLLLADGRARELEIDGVTHFEATA